MSAQAVAGGLGEVKQAMPRRSASESVSKENALEALHLAMRATGRKQRPRPGKPGFEAVEQVMQWWRADLSLIHI